MKKSNKAFCTILASLMAASALGGCGQGGGSSTVSSDPASGNSGSSSVAASSAEESKPAGYEGERKLSVQIWRGTEEIWGAKDFNEILAFQKMQENADIQIMWDHDSDFNVMVNSGEMTDLMWYNWNPDRSQQFFKNGTIVDVAPIVSEYVPNLTALYEKYPAVNKQMYTDNGESLYFPWLTPVNQMTEGCVLRKDYLDAVGLAVPTTTKEFEAALRAMQDKDVNGNGKKDEVFSGYATQMYKLMWGFGTTDDWMIKDNNVVFGPTMTEYREALNWFATLYKDNLLDKDSFSGTSGENGDPQEVFKKHHVNNISVGFVDNPGVVADTIKMGEQVNNAISYAPVPAMSYNGKSTTIYSALKRSAQIYGLAVSKSCDPAKYPLVGEWMNYLYSEESMNLFNWGIEGDTYTVVDGKKQYTDKIMKDPDWSPSVAASKYVANTFMCVTDPDSNNALLDETGKECVRVWNDTDISMSYEPILFLTDEELAKTDTFNKEIATLKAEFRDKVVTGQIALTDETWNQYQENLKKIGVEDATAVRNEALKRFNSK